MKDRISKRTVDALPVPDTGELRLWDTETAGFCVRSYAKTAKCPKGRKVYAIKYRVNGRQRWFTVGEHGTFTPDQAREKAELVARRAGDGIDLQAERVEARQGMDVAELVALYLKLGPKDKPSKRASSWSTDKGNLEHHVLPILGKFAAMAVTKSDTNSLRAAIVAGKTAKTVKTKARGKAVVTGGEGSANRVMAVGKAMYSWAIEHGHLKGENPFGKLKQSATSGSERFLSDGEAATLFEVLDRLEAAGELNAKYASIFKLLLLTGARRNEIAALRWSEVDLQREVLTLPPIRTKAGATTGDRRITLNSLALEILGAQPHGAKAIYVFPASKGQSGFTTGAPKAWREKVQPAAQLAGVRLHDLRHSFASFALADGASLAIIQKALGHSKARSTERYAHLTFDPVKTVSEGVAARLRPKIKEADRSAETG